MTSRLAKIEVPKGCGPFDLLRDWLDDFKSHSKISFVLFNLATASRSGDVKNRFIGLQKLADDGIIFNTNPHSPKVKHLIRIEGVAEKLPSEIGDESFQSQPLYAKMRSTLIPVQGEEVEWDDLKRRHDDLLEKVHKGEIELRPSGNFVTYKIVPTMFDFYHASENEIADRILYKNDSGVWSHSHITA